MLDGRRSLQLAYATFQLKLIFVGPDTGLAPRLYCGRLMKLGS